MSMFSSLRTAPANALYTDLEIVAVLPPGLRIKLDLCIKLDLRSTTQQTTLRSCRAVACDANTAARGPAAVARSRARAAHFEAHTGGLSPVAPADVHLSNRDQNA